MNLGPPWRLDSERLAMVHQLAAPVASVLAPLPAAIGMALVNLEPQGAITTLVMLSFPMTLLVGLQFMLARSMGMIGWASAVVAGVVAAIVMMIVLDMQPPPPSVDALRGDAAPGPVGPAGALFRFIAPGVVTSLAFWLVIRVQCPRAFVGEAQ